MGNILDEMIYSGFKLFAALLLVILNGLFVAAEFAFVKIRASKVESMVREGRTSADLIKEAKMRHSLPSKRRSGRTQMGKLLLNARQSESVWVVVLGQLILFCENSHGFQRPLISSKFKLKREETQVPKGG